MKLWTRQILSIWLFGGKQLLFNSNDLKKIDITELCKTVWFARGEDFAKLIDLIKKNSIVDLIETLIDYEPIDFTEAIAMLILYNNIVKMVYCNTIHAYEYESLARELTMSLLKFYELFPTYYKIPMLMCLIDSENVDDHCLAKEMIDILKHEESRNDYIYTTIKDLFDDKSIKLLKFGRLPERNKVYKRDITNDESIFLSVT